MEELIKEFMETYFITCEELAECLIRCRLFDEPLHSDFESEIYNNIYMED